MNDRLDTANTSTTTDAVRVRELDVNGEQGALKARLYVSAAKAKRDTLVIFFPGGGFETNDLDDADGFLRSLAGISLSPVVLGSSYTTATVRPFPAAVEDAHAVLLWAQKNKTRLGWNGKHLLVAGIEAGANLAAVCTLMSRDRGASNLAGQILIMPMLDPGLSSCSMREMPNCIDKEELVAGCSVPYRGYLPNAVDRTHPYASPLQSSRLSNLPPALILSAEGDPSRDEAEAYGAKLASFRLRTTVRRILRAPRVANDRIKCVYTESALVEIANFITVSRSSGLSLLPRTFPTI
jgi:acetyl esterase